MKYAICILAHNKPKLLSRITNYLTHDNMEIFIHLDAKSDISEFNFIKDATFIEKRVRVYWGRPSMVIAMYNLIEYVVNNTDCGYIMFISGEDFPIISPDKYDSYIDVTKNYIEYEKLPKKNWYEGGINRINYYYFFNSSESIMARIVMKVQRVFNITRSFDKLPYVIFGGSQWININLDAAKYILQNWNKYYKFFKFSHIPDELIFQTILMNSPFKDTIVNRNYRYTDFYGDESHPRNLDVESLNEIITSGDLFCRKIADECVFDRLNNMVLHGEDLAWRELQ